MKVVFSDRQLAHDPKHFLVSGAPQPNPEVPERARRLRRRRPGRQATTWWRRSRAASARSRRCNTPEYLQFLSGIVDRWRPDRGRVRGGGPQHPPERPAVATGPAAIPGPRWDRPAGTWPTPPVRSPKVRGSPRSPAPRAAVHAARLVLGGDRAAYALCRPPGHHAFADMAGGFCFLNNAAIAAQHLRDRGAARVAVLDVDLHHGNGTQGIFWARGDVLTVSLHADPAPVLPVLLGL